MSVSVSVCVCVCVPWKCCTHIHASWCVNIFALFMHAAVYSYIYTNIHANVDLYKCWWHTGEAARFDSHAAGPRRHGRGAPARKTTVGHTSGWKRAHPTNGSSESGVYTWVDVSGCVYTHTVNVYYVLVRGRVYQLISTHISTHFNTYINTFCLSGKLVAECALILRQIDRKKPPLPGGFLGTMFADQEPCVRDFTTRCDGRISSWNLLHTALDQGT